MKTLVVGIGSDIRADDGVGLHVVRELKDRISSDQVDIAELGTAGLGLLDSVPGYDRLVLVDAILTGARPGTVHELRGPEVARASHLGPGHDADLPTVLALGEKIAGGSMPREVIVFAVEASDLTTVSTDLTPAVADAVAETADRIESLCNQDSAIAE